MSNQFWGADTTSELKPQWPRVRRPDRTGIPGTPADLSANTFATDAGWVKQWPWGTETLVAIQALATKLGVANVASFIFSTIAGSAGDGSGKLVNASAQSLRVTASFDEPVSVSGTPTLALVSSNGSVANITLSYNASLSTANTTGTLVFENTNFALASAGYVGQNLVINSSSTVTGWDGITDLTSNVVANGVPTAFSLAVPVYQEKPVHTGTTTNGTATNAATQYVTFVFKFNQAVVLSTVPTVRAIATEANAQSIGNLTLTYTATGSNVAAGNLVFKSNATSFATLGGNAVYTVNSTSTLTGFEGIKNAIGGVVANTVAVANTFTVVSA